MNSAVGQQTYQLSAELTNDQPDVEASKVETRRLTTAYEETGALPPEIPLFTGDGVSLFTDATNATALKQTVGQTPSLTAFLRALFSCLQPGDYCGLLAYIEMNADHQRRLQEMRRAVRDRKRVAACLEFGPRFLHSTGQAYKGGPNSGVFLQIPCDDATNLPVPGQRYTVYRTRTEREFPVIVLTPDTVEEVTEQEE